MLLNLVYQLARSQGSKILRGRVLKQLLGKSTVVQKVVSPNLKGRLTPLNYNTLTKLLQFPSSHKGANAWDS